MNRLLLLFLLGAAILSCQPKSSSADQAGNTTTEPAPSANVAETPAPAAPATGSISYPSVPFDTLAMLWEKCDYVDFVFYNFNFSMSQNEKTGIQSSLRHIAEEVPVINPSCAAIGRMFFQVDGRNALEGDIFIGDGCVYYVWYKDGKKAYANSMTDMGKNFYANIFSQMMKSQDQTQ